MIIFRRRGEGKVRTDLGSAPASNSNSTSGAAVSHSGFDKPLMKRTALCSGVSDSSLSKGSTSRPSWSRRTSKTSSASPCSSSIVCPILMTS